MHHRLQRSVSAASTVKLTHNEAHSKGHMYCQILGCIQRFTLPQGECTIPIYTLYKLLLIRYLLSQGRERVRCPRRAAKRGMADRGESPQRYRWPAEWSLQSWYPAEQTQSSTRLVPPTQEERRSMASGEAEPRQGASWQAVLSQCSLHLVGSCLGCVELQ